MFVGVPPIAYLAGKASLAVRAGGLLLSEGAVLALWSLFALAGAVYLRTLWGDAGRPARAYTAALGLGLLAIVASASVHRRGHCSRRRRFSIRSRS